MSGHSKWSTIKRAKGKTDAQRAKIFTKVGREMTIAVKSGGADPAVNGKLRDLIAKAKSLNVPNENIERILKKANGADSKDNYENITYEGYGPGGVAMMVECLTDNKNRTVSDLRHYFDKYGGNLGTSGCVSFMFTQKGVLVFENDGFDENTVMEDAVEAGADDIVFGDDAIEIYTSYENFHEVLTDLEKKYNFVSSQIEQIPSSRVKITDEESKIKMQKLMERLDDNDDVGEVWHNLENTEEVLC